VVSVRGELVYKRREEEKEVKGDGRQPLTVRGDHGLSGSGVTRLSRSGVTTEEEERGGEGRRGEEEEEERRREGGRRKEEGGRCA